MSKKLFIYKSFGETLSFAESLGWKDNVEDDDWNTSVADSLEDEALTYIQEQGYRIIEEKEEDIDPQPSLLDVKAYPTLNALFGRYDDDEKI